MPIIVGPTGKLSDISDPKAYQEWLNTPGFRPATPAEDKEYYDERRAKYLQQQYANDSKTGVYISTVSQGGKDGYANASGGIIKELQKLGVNVSTHYTGQRVAILFHNPYGIPRIEAPYRILYTMFESDKIPDDWVDYMEAADEVWAPSKWCADVFAKAGIKASVIPLGYDDNAFTPIERKTANEERRPFTFLHYDAFNIRKGFVEVFKAFTAEFEKTEAVKLILKSRLNQAPIPIVKDEYPNIECIFGKIENHEFKDLMGRSDCFVFPSRGEGFGMTPLEAMATGLPAIVPNAHGISEYFNSDYMYEATVKETCPALYSRYKNQDVGNMVVCDVDDLRKKMRWCVTHQKEIIEMGKKAQDYVKKWTYAKTAAIIKERLDKIFITPFEPKRVVNVLPLELVK